MRALEVALVDAVGAGEAAALVPEELALDQLRCHRAAVERDERLLPAPAELVHRLRDELLAGAALALDEHGRVGRRDARDHVVQLLHRVRRADQRPEAPEAAQLGAQVLDLVVQLAPARDVREDGPQARQLDRLGEVVDHALAEGVDRGIHRRVAGDQHDVGERHGRELGDQLRAVAVRQAQIDQRQVWHALAQELTRLGEGGRRLHREAFLGEDFGDGFLEARIIVDHDRVWHSSPPAGQARRLVLADVGGLVRRNVTESRTPAWPFGSQLSHRTTGRKKDVRTGQIRVPYRADDSIRNPLQCRNYTRRRPRTPLELGNARLLEPGVVVVAVRGDRVQKVQGEGAPVGRRARGLPDRERAKHE